MVELSNVTMREDVKKHIEKITSPDQIYTLFKLLNYPKSVFFDSSFKRKKEEVLVVIYCKFSNRCNIGNRCGWLSRNLRKG